MRIIVTGGRDYTNQAAVESALRSAEVDAYRARRIRQLPAGSAVTLVHGAARGADALAARCAAALGWAIEAHPADWAAHGRAAGPIRNQEMASLGADLLIAFPGGRGTADMVRRAKRAGIPVRHAPHAAPQRPQEPRNPQTHTRTTPTPENPAAGATGPRRRRA